MASDAAKGCPTCGGKGYVNRNDGWAPVDRGPCPECARVEAIVARAREEEREQCAKIAERFNVDGSLADFVEDAIAAAIRSGQ